MKTEIRRFPSSSDPDKSYMVEKDEESGELTCNCPTWIYNQKGNRTCKHTEQCGGEWNPPEIPADENICPYCGEQFAGRLGVGIHKSHCHQNPAKMQTKPTAISEIKEFSSHKDSPYLVREEPPIYIPRTIYRSKTDLDVLEKAIKVRENILLIGETGTGKSHILRLLAWKLCLPYIRVQLCDATTPEDLFGQWVPAGGDKGSFRWQDGVLTTFMRNGGMFVADELNGAKAGLNFVFHSITDMERRMTLTQKDGEVIYAHPDFVFCATMNLNYEGCKPLNRALFDRFGVVLEYNGHPSLDKILPKELVALKEKIDEALKTEDIDGVLSIRGLLQFQKNSETMGKEVAKRILLNKFEGVGREAILEIMTAIGI